MQPKPLKGEADEQWGRVVEALRRQGTLQQNTAFAIYNHCQVWALAERWQVAVDALDWPTYDKCALMKDADDNVTMHMEPKAEPAFDKLRYQRSEVDKTLKTLGLTPDSIGRVRIPTGSDGKKQSLLAQLQAGAAIRRVK